jgi:hypothetical protein
MHSKTGGADINLNARINKAKGIFAQLSLIWQSSQLTKKLKLKIFNSNVKSVLLYGSESWLVSTQIKQRVQSFFN